MGRLTTRRRVERIDVSAGARTSRADTLVVEEPLELRVGGRAYVVTMRTPGHDVELVHGFLAGEGVIRSSEDVMLARYCEGAVVDDESGTPRNTYNVIDVTLAPGVAPPTTERNVYASSSCGVCGTASIEAIEKIAPWSVAQDEVTYAADTLAQLPDRLRAAQSAFDRTGGLHAAGLFTADGELLVVREDVGRHNAVDKVVGWALLEGRLPLRSTVLMVSGRVSFELTQKALMAGIPCLAAVSAPSSLAVEFGEASGMTVVGFLRPPRMNVYTRSDRVV